MDRTFLAAALRETREEVGILPDQVEILGQVGPPQLSFSGLRVWPYVVRSPFYCRKSVDPFICCDVATVTFRVLYMRRPDSDMKPLEKKLRYLHYGWVPWLLHS